MTSLGKPSSNITNLFYAIKRDLLVMALNRCSLCNTYVRNHISGVEYSTKDYGSIDYLQILLTVDLAQKRMFLERNARKNKVKNKK